MDNSIEKFTIILKCLLYMDGIPLSINCKRFNVLNWWTKTTYTHTHKLKEGREKGMMLKT